MTANSQRGYTVTVHIVRDDGFDGDGPVTHHFTAPNALLALKAMVDRAVRMAEQ